ncbi:MAG TPA: 50S ribosomal protein L17 [Sphingobacteriaceae bacterium]|nr:50S ribosomal protein L17 [Sphingobacteriaceae bacterium]
MRHGKKFNHLGRTDSHRKAMLANMASSLIKHKRITTTLAKAKALRKYAEPLITKSKDDTTHSRRSVFSYLKDKDAVTILFREVSDKVANRPGGYTRIIKLENRAGDNAEMAIIELVDYNEIYTKGSGVQVEKKATRRRGSGKKAAAAAAPTEASETPAVEEAPEVVETAVEEAPEAVEAAVEATEEVVAEAEVTETAEETPAADEADASDDQSEEKKDA